VLELLNDDSLNVKRLQLLDEKTFLVIHAPKKEPMSKTGNVCLAAAVTSYARLRLYTELDRYKEHVAYMVGI